jgi:hypothetical protein
MVHKRDTEVEKRLDNVDRRIIGLVRQVNRVSSISIVRGGYHVKHQAFLQSTIDRIRHLVCTPFDDSNGDRICSSSERH